MRIEIFQDGSVAVDGKIQELVLDFQGEEVDFPNAKLSIEKYGDYDEGEFSMLVVETNIIA